MDLFNTNDVQKERFLPEIFTRSITFSEDFPTSKRFLRYKDDIKKKINDFLTTSYGVTATKNGKEVEISKNTVNKMLTYPDYFKNGATNYFTYCFKCIIDEDTDDKLQLDVTSLPHICRYSVLWKEEAKLFTMLSSSGDESLYDGEVILICLKEYLSNSGKVPPIVPSIDKLMDLEFTELCYDYIREQEIIQHIDEYNWYRSCQLNTDADVFNFIKRYTTVLYVSIEGIMKTLIDLYRNYNKNKKDPLIIQNANLKASESIMRKQLERSERDLNRKIESLQKKLESERSKNSEYKKQISKAKSDSNKQYKSELHELDKQIKNSQHRYNELDTKYQEALERIQILEELVEEQEEVTINDTNYCTEFYQNKFVFVRNRHTERYSIMKELSDLFPNAIFTDKFSDLKPDLIDGIIFLTRYEKHGIYYKARDFCKTNNIKSVHCDTSNTERILAIMYNKFILNDNNDRSSYKS